MYQLKKVFGFINHNFRLKQQKYFCKLHQSKYFSFIMPKYVKLSLHIFFWVGIGLFSSAQAQYEDTKFDEKYGKILSDILEKQIGVYEEKQIRSVVDTVGQKLARNLVNPHFTYTFKILDLQDPNAFSLPGGYIYVTRGLLALVNSEDELAGVIGHEIIHSQNRHSYHQMKTGVISGILQLPGSIAGSYLGNDLGNLIAAPFTLGSNLLMSGYSKKNEKEADIEGILLAAESGYDPLALHNLLKNIKTSTEFKTGEEEEKSYFNHHPYTPKRLSYIQSQALKLNFSKPNPIFENEQFLYLLDGLTVGTNPNNGIFIENTYLHPDKKITLTFPPEWEISNTSKAVIGITEDEEALILLSLNPEKRKAENAANEFLEMISAKEVEVLNKKSLTINNQPAYLVTLQSFIGGKTMFFQNLWVEVDSLTYNIIGTGSEQYLSELKTTGLSFGKTSTADLESIKIDVLKIVEALEGESLDELTHRINGKPDTKYLEIINSFEKKSKLKKGQKVKVIMEEKYLDKQ